MNINMPISAFGARGLTSITVSVLPFTTGTGTYTPSANSIDPGDVIIAFDEAINSSGLPTFVTPSGSVTVSSQNTSNSRTIVYYKICNGTEDQGALPKMHANQYAHIRVLIVKGNVPIQLATVKNFIPITRTNNDPPAITLSANNVVAPAVGIAGYISTGNISPITFNPAPDVVFPNFANQQILAGKTYNKNITPVNHTIDMGDHGNDNGMFCFYLEVK